MTPTILWWVLATLVVLAVGMTATAVRARATARELAAGVRAAHPVDRDCSRIGHVYRFHGTGLRCSRCGNHVARLEGEIYGRVEDGRIERRREPR